MGTQKIMNRATRIGEAARETGLTVDAIRFYEKQSLLPRPARTAGGFRLYSGESVERLQFILQAQTLGFSLAEIRELLLLRDKKLEECSHVRALLQGKLASVRQMSVDCFSSNGQQCLNCLSQPRGQVHSQALRECSRWMTKYRPRRTISEYSSHGQFLPKYRNEPKAECRHS